jgi:cell division protease FtsH
MNGILKQVSLWLILGIILILALTTLSSGGPTGEKLTAADFERTLQNTPEKIERIDVLHVSDSLFEFSVRLKEPIEGSNLIKFKYSREPEEWRAAANSAEPPIPFELEEKDTTISTLLISILPILLIIGLFWFFMFRQMQGGSNKAMSFGKSKARLVNHSDKVVTFEDVAGVDEAKEELREIIEFLKDPKRFSRLGGKIPKGVLLIGPPGTGKTLLARAVAGEAHVPFFSISGSDFVEMFVGVGASRVRDLFQQGQKHAPCIIFIDEIDAVGRQRGAGLGGGHDEREQTLNQLLVEMDGFNTTEGVILMAATNRPDVLDRALLRPGRFDRQVMVGNPDVRGREAILNIHISNNKVPIEESVSIHNLARGTAGFSGADLANLVNEAALLAARRNQDQVGGLDFEEAKDRVMMGPERRSMVLNPDDKKKTAYHEAGHALIGMMLEHGDPVHKTTIIPRGPSLGLTSFLPEEDRTGLSRAYCLATIRIMMGGRAAEEVCFSEFTSGASNDLQRSTKLANHMVCEWGMSELGPVSFGNTGEVFLGRDFARERDFSDETAAAIDKSIHQIVEDAYADAKKMLEEHKDLLVALGEELYEKEVLDVDEMLEVVDRLGSRDILAKRYRDRKRPEDTPKADPKQKLPANTDIKTEQGVDDMPTGDAIPEGA